jgi:hypothetical protein
MELGFWGLKVEVQDWKPRVEAWKLVWILVWMRVLLIKVWWMLGNQLWGKEWGPYIPFGSSGGPHSESYWLVSAVGCHLLIICHMYYGWSWQTCVVSTMSWDSTVLAGFYAIQLWHLCAPAVDQRCSSFSIGLLTLLLVSPCTAMRFLCASESCKPSYGLILAYLIIPQPYYICMTCVTGMEMCQTRLLCLNYSLGGLICQPRGGVHVSGPTGPIYMCVSFM